MVDLKEKARIKFPRANEMKFNKEALEQASSKYIAEYRTWKMRQRVGTISKVLDVCAGMGGDTIAMALRWKVVSVEKNPAIFEMLKHNTKVYNVDKQVDFILGDIITLLDDKTFLNKLKGVDCIFFDPSRRTDGERTVKIEEYDPPLALVEKLKEISPNICVKISPGVDFERIKYDCDIEVVSFKGEVKEVVLWFGKFKQSENGKQIIGTKLPEKISLTKQSIKEIALSGLKKFLYEPDPAFIKARLVKEIAQEYGLNMIEKNIAYLTSDLDIKTPLLKKYRILVHTDLDYDDINKALNKLNIGNCDFKARGIDIDLKHIHKEVIGKGHSKGLVIFTRSSNKKLAIICKYTN